MLCIVYKNSQRKRGPQARWCWSTAWPEFRARWPWRSPTWCTRGAWVSTTPSRWCGTGSRMYRPTSTSCSSCCPSRANCAWDPAPGSRAAALRRTAIACRPRALWPPIWRMLPGSRQTPASSSIAGPRRTRVLNENRVAVRVSCYHQVRRSHLQPPPHRRCPCAWRLTRTTCLRPAPPARPHRPRPPRRRFPWWKWCSIGIRRWPKKTS